MNGKAPPRKKEVLLDGNPDLEQHFILRLPQAPAEELRKEVQSGSQLLKDKLSIELEPDHRHGHVRFNNYIFNAKVVDLPSVIESLKTCDKKTFYKTADVAQMMVCTTDDDINVEDMESPKKKDKDKRYLWNHGITPSLKNVRKRRFRKVLKKKYMDQPELEKEVRRLFRYDAEAIDVKWEVVTEDEKPLPDADSSQTSGRIQTSGTITNPASGLKRTDTSLSMDVAEFFGELSSSEEEEDKEVNIMDSGEDESSRLGESSMQAAEGEAGDDTAALEEKLQELTQQLEEIREKRMELEERLTEEDNDMMRDQLREHLQSFLQEESEKEKEHEILSSMLNQ